MRINKITWRNRNDFGGLMKCEHCGHAEDFVGYADAVFCLEVMPSWGCEGCGKKGKDPGAEPRNIAEAEGGDFDHDPRYAPFRAAAAEARS